MKTKNKLLASLGALVAGLGLVGVLIAYRVLATTSLEPDPLAVGRHWSPKPVTHSPLPEPECSKPSLTVTEPPLGSTIDRNPVFIGGGMTPNTSISVMVDADWYIYPPDRPSQRLNVPGTNDSRSDADGNFRLQLNLHGDRVVFTGAANAAGVLPTRGIEPGPHRLLILGGRGRCSAFSEELYYTVADDNG